MELGNFVERITPQCYGCINEILRSLTKEDGTGSNKPTSGQKS
jgi:hypothetical protein